MRSAQYDLVGEGYLNFKQKPGHQDWPWKYIKRELGKLEKEKILFAGCGGDSARINELISQYPKLSIFGVDLSSYMIIKLKELLDKSIPKDNFLVEDICQTSFESSSFNIVISRQTIHYLLSPDDFFKEAARLLKPGGKLIFVVNHPMRDWYYQPSRQYGSNEEITTLSLRDSDIQRPSHSLSDYFTPAFFSFFTVHTIEEWRNPKFVNEFNLPYNLGITAERK